MNQILFLPRRGLSSCHLQTIIGGMLSGGAAPPSRTWPVMLSGGDQLCCEVSVPSSWTKTTPTVVLVHGLGGNHRSNYMIRMARKLFQKGYKAVRVNLRGCGSGENLSKLPYNAGTSHDLRVVLEALQLQEPASRLIAIGFSLGGNIVLKLAGELAAHSFISVCAPLDLLATVELIQKPKNYLYHQYYLRKISAQARPWLKKKVHSLYEFDDHVTARLWGYQGADEYYKAASCLQYVPQITRPCHLLFSADDPFVDRQALDGVKLPPQVKIWVASGGGHMGFIGKTGPTHDSHWLDDQLLEWIKIDAF